MEVFWAMQQQGMVPDVITYNALISTCEKGKQPEWALQALGAMQRQDIAPDVVMYKALIGACANGKRKERALEALKAMQHQGMVHDVGTKTLVDVCEIQKG